MSREQFETQSIYQAAFCLCAGLSLVELDRASGSKATFVFEGQDAQKKALGFYNGAKVAAQAYSENFRSLKDMIFKR